MIVALVLLLPIVAIVVVTLHDIVRRPTFRKLAFRNASRRKGEAVLVLIGSLLGTAIITASLLVGDTLGASIRDSARTQLGPTDEVARVIGLEHLDAVERALDDPIPGTDGTLTLVSSGAAVASSARDRRAEPTAFVLETDFDRARTFGAGAGDTGFAGAGPTPVGDEAVVGRDLANALEVAEGDRVDVFAFGSKQTFTVRGIVSRLGVAGFNFTDSSNSPNLFVAPGTITRLAQGGQATQGAAPPEGRVLISNEGGVTDAATPSIALLDTIHQRIEGIPGVELDTVKLNVLDDADQAAAEFTELFGGIGAFSVLAGILLLVNVFVMLADERKGELGMLRAVGLKRNHLVRTFGIEGAVYAVVASVIGALIGIGIGRAIVIVAQDLFSSSDDEFELTLRFVVEPASIITGFLIGTVISLITVWGASFRVSRLNVIRAIRDLPEPRLARQRTRTLAFGGLGVVVGGILFATGVAAGHDGWFGALAGPPIMAACAIPLLIRLLPRRLTVSAACLISLLWGIFCFSLIPSVFEGIDIPAFVLQGVILVTAAVALLIANDEIGVRVSEKLSGSSRMLAARLGFAYPLARKFRTGMLLGMFALVIFTLTFLSVLSNLFVKQGPKFTNELDAGYDIVADSNFGNPVTAEELQQQPGVASVATLLRAFPEFSTSGHPDADEWALTGFDEKLLVRDTLVLSSRDPRFASDRAAMEAVLRDPSLAIVPDFFLQDGGGPPESILEPGETLTVHNAAAGQTRELTVAGIQGSDWVFNGVLVSDDFAREFLGPRAVAARHYVQVEPGQDANEVAARLTGNLIGNGVDADSIASLVQRNLQQQEGFFQLMQGYLALGLLIGIAGLGVVMVRAVRERRRQIGMLRAMGFPSRVVRTAFLLEAGFVAVQGIAVGVVLALIVAWSVLSNSDTFGDQRLGFSVPWLTLAITLVVTLVAAVAATAVPASQAARIKPAVALRIAD